jgi:hypothetical protein
MLSVLPIDMRGSERPIGITTRADAKRSVGLEALVQFLRAVSDEMKDGPRGPKTHMTENPDDEAS